MCPVCQYIKLKSLDFLSPFLFLRFLVILLDVCNIALYLSAENDDFYDIANDEVEYETHITTEKKIQVWPQVVPLSHIEIGVEGIVSNST